MPDIYARAQHRRRMTIFIAGGILLAMIIAVSLAATNGLSKTKNRGQQDGARHRVHREQGRLHRDLQLDILTDDQAVSRDRGFHGHLRRVAR